MARTARILLVTTGLAIAGAAFGATAAIMALTIGLALTEGLREALRGLSRVLGFAAFAGAVLGAAVAPAGAWILMRRVSLGRAIVGTFVGTAVGGVTGLLIGTSLRRLALRTPFAFDDVDAAITGAVLGFFVAAALLRR